MALRPPGLDPSPAVLPSKAFCFSILDLHKMLGLVRPTPEPTDESPRSASSAKTSSIRCGLWAVGCGPPRAGPGDHSGDEPENVHPAVLDHTFSRRPARSATAQSVPAPAPCTRSHQSRRRDVMTLHPIHASGRSRVGTGRATSRASRHRYRIITGPPCGNVAQLLLDHAMLRRRNAGRIACAAWYDTERASTG